MASTEKTCDWKPGGSFLNIRFAQNLFRFNLRPDLNAKSPLLQRFEGHAKPTVVADETKLDCIKGECLVISSDLIDSLLKVGLREFQCGDWYLITDGPELGCDKQTVSHSLKISKSGKEHCVVGILVDVRTAGLSSGKSGVATSSLFVTGTKPEVSKLTPAPGKADND